MMNRYGHSFERSAIFAWIKEGNDTCPLTRNPLTVSGLLTNRVLKREILEWKAQTGMVIDSEEINKEDPLHHDIQTMMIICTIPETEEKISLHYETMNQQTSVQDDHGTRPGQKIHKFIRACLRRPIANAGA